VGVPLRVAFGLFTRMVGGIPVKETVGAGLAITVRVAELVHPLVLVTVTV
jgi:hypothetical protein